MRKLRLTRIRGPVQALFKTPPLRSRGGGGSPKDVALLASSASPLTRKKANSPGIWWRHLKTHRCILPAQQKESRGEHGLHTSKTYGFTGKAHQSPPLPDSSFARSQHQLNRSGGQIRRASIFVDMNFIPRQRESEYRFIRWRVKR